MFNLIIFIMANVNTKPSYQAHLSKTGFDVSQTFNFSSSCGHILPVWYDIANPGEHYSLSTNLFTRTQPLASAPMDDNEGGKGHKHVYYLFQLIFALE